MEFTDRELETIATALSSYYHQEEQNASAMSKMGLDGRYFMRDGAKAKDLLNRIIEEN